MIKPLGNIIICKPVLTEDKTTSGIILQQETIPKKWVVAAIWPWAIKEDGTRNHIDLKIGDIVYFPKNQVVEVEDDWMLYIMNAAAVNVLERKG